MSDFLYGLGFFISLALSVWLWLLAVRRPSQRWLWALLASAWSLGILATVGWGIYGMLGGEDQPAWTDILYILRYPLIALAVGLYPPAQRFRPLLLLETLAALAIGGALVWWTLTTPLLSASSQNRDYILAGMLYPVLDVGMLWWMGRRWWANRSLTTSGWSGQTQLYFWLMLSTLAYGVANWSNYWARGLEPNVNLPLALACWLLTDVLALIGVWRGSGQPE